MAGDGVLGRTSEISVFTADLDTSEVCIQMLLLWDWLGQPWLRSLEPTAELFVELFVELLQLGLGDVLQCLDAGPIGALLLLPALVTQLLVRHLLRTAARIVVLLLFELSAGAIWASDGRRREGVR